MTIRTKPASAEYRENWDRVFEGSPPSVGRWYRCQLVERTPLPGREGVIYSTIIRRASRRDVARAWDRSPLRLVSVEVVETASWSRIR